MRFLILCFAEETKALLLVPVLQNLVRQYSKISLSLVCRPQCKIFFHNIPGVHSLGIDLKKKYRGPFALYRLCRELHKLGPYVRGLDLDEDQNNYLLRFFFFFRNVYFTKILSIKKKQQQLIHHKRKDWGKLPHLSERYLRSFRRAGLELKENNLVSFPALNLSTEVRAQAHNFLEKKGLRKLKTKKNLKNWIAFVPFTKQKAKNYPIEKIGELMYKLQKELESCIFLFGKQEEKLKKLYLFYTKDMALNRDEIILIPGGEENLELEMGLLSQMNLFIGMDSIYMHLSALLGVKLLSIWGPTHPYIGYGPYAKEKAHKSIQIQQEALPCRPCSLKGERKCLRQDLACMQWIPTNEILEGVKNLS